MLGYWPLTIIHAGAFVAAVFLLLEIEEFSRPNKVPLLPRAGRHRVNYRRSAYELSGTRGVPPPPVGTLETHAVAAQPEGQYPVDRMLRLVKAWLPPPRILHPWPAKRFDVTHPRWEPSA